MEVFDEIFIDTQGALNSLVLIVKVTSVDIFRLVKNDDHVVANLLLLFLASGKMNRVIDLVS